MLTNYKIQNFKIHDNTSLDLKPLTILTGMNGSGKSSVLQSLLLLRDSYMQVREFPKLLALNGKSFNLGTSEGLQNINPSIDIDCLILSMHDEDKGALQFIFQYPTTFESVIKGNDNKMDVTDLRNVSLFNDNFQYLSAFRDGPASVYQSDTYAVDTHQQISVDKGRGEYAVYFLSRFGQADIPVRQLALNPNDNNLTLQHQVDGWMSQICDNVRVRIDQNKDQYVLRYEYLIPGKPALKVSPLNTGYGISYVFPLLVAILSAKPGALLLIENPEAHIHPAGQAALMRLVNLAAAHGVQIILETHSDHIVNGALVGVHDEVLPVDTLAIYFFERDENTYNAKATCLKINDNGQIEKSPRHFFDQIQIDLSRILGFDE